MAESTNRRLRFLLAMAILSSCVGCDQATKQIAAEALRGKPPQSYFSNTLRFEHALNPGGFLSLGASLEPDLRFCVFVVLNVALLLGTICLLMIRWNMHLVKFVAIVLLLAGGLGNLIDRVFQNGCVTDFVNVGVGSIRTGIFNVADVAVTAGALALLFASWGTNAAQPERPR